MKEAYEVLLKKNFPFWDQLNKEEKQQLIAAVGTRTYEKGAFVHSASEKCLGIILVQSGQLRVYIQSAEGRDITLYRLEAGEACTLSASCFMNEITFDILIDAEEETEVLLINPAVFNQVASKNLYVENYMYKQATARFSDVMWTMQQILFLSFDKRLALFLLEESRRKGDPCIVMTHEQIAKYIGSAREVVSRMLKYFEEEGYLKLSRGKITLLDEEALEELSEDGI